MEKLRKMAEDIFRKCGALYETLLQAVGRWPLMTKVTVPASVLCMLVGAVLLADLLHKDFADAAVSDSAAGTEAFGTEFVTEAVEMETETAPQIIVSLPEYVTVSMVGESVEKDLTLYMEGENEENINGVPFQIKLVQPDQISQIQEFMDAIENPDISDFQIPPEYEGAELTEEEKLTLMKQTAIFAYAEALAQVEGNVYTDEDCDGIIYAENLTAGDYTVCYVPVMQYDAAEYAMDVTVKDKVEYKEVKTIQKKVVTAAAAGDKKTSHKEIPVEAVKENTISEVESKEQVEKAQYSTPQKMDLGITAYISEKRNETAADCEIISPDNSADTEEIQPDAEDGSSIADTEPTRTIVRSLLSISEEIRLYANPEAASLVIPYTADFVTDVNLTASSELSCLTIAKQAEGYQVSIGNPTEVRKDLTGTLTLQGKDAAGQVIKTTCKVTIIGSENKLTNADGEQLYVADASGQMVEAVVGNYSSSNTYCVEIQPESVVYYGWQTLDGVTYYYDSNGTVVTGTQTIGGVTYHFDASGKLLTAGTGIDVSKWQGTIDWGKASTAISFAVIRCGFRGTSGRIAKDPTFAVNIAGAKKNGVKVGIYFYSMAMTEAQAVEEASLAISLAKESGGLDLPIYIDMEDSCQLSLTRAQRDAIVLAFCKTVQNSGYQAGVYANKSWLTNNLTPSKYEGLSIWCAQYNTKCTYTGRYDIWQYSDKGKIPGISGYVDMNQGYY